MTKMHFQHAAGMVKAILQGEWTRDFPVWVCIERVGRTNHLEDEYEQACIVAEAFILLFRAFNPRFDKQRFLVACGLVE